MVEQPSLLANILIIIGEGFWVVSISAQLLKLHRTRNTHGLAPVSQTLHTAGNVGWAAYFAIHNLWFPFTTNVIMFFLSVATLGYTLSDRKKFATGITAIIIVAPVTTYALIKYPASGGWIGMTYNFIAGTPFIYRIIKRKKTSGLSEHGIYFALIAMLCTFAYALIIHSWPLIIGCAQGLVYEAIVIRYYYRYRHQN